MSPRARKPVLLRAKDPALRQAVPHNYEAVKLVGVKEAAAILGIHKGHFVRVRDELEAVAELGGGPVFVEADVRALARKRKATARRREKRGA